MTATRQAHYDRHYDHPRGVDSHRPQSQSPQPDPLVSPLPPPSAQLPLVLLRPLNCPLGLLLQPAHGLLSSTPPRCSSFKRLKTSIYASTSVYYDQSSPSAREYSFPPKPKESIKDEGKGKALKPPAVQKRELVA